MAFKYRIKYKKNGTTKTKNGKTESITFVLEKFDDCEILELDLTEIKET